MKSIFSNWLGTYWVILANTGSLVGTTVVTSGLGFLYWWLAARQFTPEAVGLGSAAIWAMMFFGNVSVLGIGTLLIGELPRQPGKEGSLISTALLVVSMTGGGLGLFFAFIAPWMSADLRVHYIKEVVDGTLPDGETKPPPPSGPYVTFPAPPTRQPKPTPPIGPFVTELTLNYTATQQITLSDDGMSKFEDRLSRFYHIAPFGHAEQHPFLNSANKVFLLPQFGFQRDGAPNKSEAEFYIGLTGLKPLQNLALLFQVADGTADPQSEKPPQHIHWSYLRGNEWTPLANDAVDDKTGGLLKSGIVTVAMPRDASDTNTLLPAGMHWIRAAVACG